MKKLMEYKNLLSSDLTDLDKQVNAEIRAGWVPFGTVVRLTGEYGHPTVKGVVCDYFVQAVVRYEDVEVSAACWGFTSSEEDHEED